MTTTRVLSLGEMIPPSRLSRMRRDDLFSSPSRGGAKYKCIWFSDVPEIGVLPNIVVPLEGEPETLYADVASYFSDYSPISAYCHIFDARVAEHFLERGLWRDTSGRSGAANSRTNLWVGVICGEALTASYLSGGDEGDVSYALCRRTLGFVQARHSVLYPEVDPTRVSEAWIRLRHQGGQEISSAGPVSGISELLYSRNKGIGHFNRSELNVIGELLFDSYEPKHFWMALQQMYPAIESERESFERDFDSRVPAFERLSSSVDQSGRGSELDSIALAFFANQILPGSFAHTRLVARRINRYPSILVWYGVFASLSEEFSPHQVFSGLGAKLLRDIRAPFDVTSPPASDLNVEELTVLSRVGLPLRTIKPTQARVALVSILPGIEVPTRLGSGGDSPAQDLTGNVELVRHIAERDAKIAGLVEEIRKLLISTSAQSTPSGQRLPYTKRIRKRSV